MNEDQENKNVSPNEENNKNMFNKNENSSLNPIKHKEVDIMDPEAKAKSTSQKGISGAVSAVKDKAEKAKKAGETIAKIIKVLGPWGCLIVLIIIIIIGLWGFFHYMPGLTIGKLKEIAQGTVDFVQSFFIPDALADVNEDDIVEVANYLEEMDYNLVGYGFVSPVIDPSSDIVTIEDVRKQGYTDYSNKENDGKYRYYNSSGEMYKGVYYNLVGIPIDNTTGEIVDDEYTDEYGIKRSTEEIATSGSGKIVGFSNDMQSNLLKTYLLSDYRIYTLRNDDQSLLKKIYGSLAKTFGGFDGAWAKGLIKLYHAEDGIATKAWGFWDEFLGKNDISIDATGKTLNIRKGWGNATTSFKIEGWSARYGLSLEFLLSLHIGTMAPELVTAILQNFDTEVQVYLQESGAGSVASVYVEPDSSATTRTPEFGLSLQNIKDKVADAPGFFPNVQSSMLNSGALAFVNGLALTKKNALWLLKNTPLVSPDSCTGAGQAYVIEDSTYDTSNFLWFDTTSNMLEVYGIEDEDLNSSVSEFANYSLTTKNGGKFDFDAKHGAHDIGADNESYLNDNYRRLDASSYGYTESNSTTDIEKSDNFAETLVKDESFWEKVDIKDTYGNIYKIKRVVLKTNWSGEADGEEVEYEWDTYKYLIYKIGEYEEHWVGINAPKDQEKEYYEPEDYEWVDTVIWEFIVRDKTSDELKEAGIIDEDGNYLGTDHSKCSENPDLDPEKGDKCCKECLKYVEKVVAALADIEDKDYSTYTPYIARVVGSWFRDTYFVIPKEPDKAIKDYMNGLSGTEKVEGVDESSGKSQNRAVYLPGHHDSSLYDAYGKDGEINLNLVTVDEGYLADTKEYWTTYETKSDGEYQLYYLEPDGSVSDKTLETFLSEHSEYANRKEAEKAGYAFVKKAVTQKATDLQTEENEDSKVLWIAYGFDTNGSQTGWQKVTSDDGNDAVNKVYGIKDPGEDGGFYYNVLTTNTVSQIEDARRAETNKTIKTLFKYRKFYIYDGTEETALSIGEDKQHVIYDIVIPQLKEIYGSNNWASKAAQDLGKYGRSALRQAYGNTYIKSYSYSSDLYQFVTNDETQKKVDDIYENLKKNNKKRI